MNENLKPVEKLTPFTKMIMTIGTLPSSFYASMSYYESMVWLYEYLKNEVIPTINNNGEAVEELQEKFIELKNYIDNYFSNLDVQEEINNKLDEMAQDGTLADMIAEYIKMQGQLVYNSVQEMREAENIQNGSFLKTYGFYEYNDGGGALYKTRTITNEDIVDNSFIIALHDPTLIAELIIPNTLNPLILGAKGDNSTDDLIILKKALKYCIDNGNVFYIDKQYYISDSLLDENDYDTSESGVYITINMKGNTPDRNNTYRPDLYSTIRIANAKDVFKNLKIRGSISNITFTTTSRNTAGSIFNNCILNSFAFLNNNVSDVGAFLLDTDIYRVSMIKDNRFLSTYTFAKSSTKNITCTDSMIKNNYINGGEELNNNNCFEFVDYNGSIIESNFIDYYRTIYRPKFSSPNSFDGVTSIGNNYQVFRYLYEFEWNRGFNFNSIGDIFNWNDPSSLQKLSNYDAIKYTGHDGNEYDLPPYIMAINDTYKINIQNATIQRHMSNLIFIKSALGVYSYAQANLTLNGIDKYTSSLVSIATGKIYNGGSYKFNYINLPFIHNLETIPDSIAEWSDYYLGQKIKVNGKLYRRYYDTENSQLGWKEIYFD